MDRRSCRYYKTSVRNVGRQQAARLAAILPCSAEVAAGENERLQRGNFEANRTDGVVNRVGALATVALVPNSFQYFLPVPEVGRHLFRQ